MLLLVVGVGVVVGVTGKHDPTDDEADNDAWIPDDEAATWTAGVAAVWGLIGFLLALPRVEVIAVSYLGIRANFRSSLLQRQADVAIVYFGYCNVRPLGALHSDVVLSQRIAMLEAWSNVRPLGALQFDVALSIVDWVPFYGYAGLEAWSNVNQHLMLQFMFNVV